MNLLTKKTRNIIYACTVVIAICSFVLGFLLCTQIYYEFPLNQIVVYEGYHGQPIYGHYVEFIDSFITKEKYDAKLR